MSRKASMITLKAKPGQRDQVKRVWEKYARDYISGSAVDFYYCFDDNDADTVIVFGLADEASAQDFAKQPWFPDYQRDTHALLAEPAEMRSMTPQYVKIGA